MLEKYGPSSNETLGADMSPLDVLVEPIDSNILHIKIGAPGRWEVPQKEIFINTGAGESQLADFLKLFMRLGFRRLGPSSSDCHRRSETVQRLVLCLDDSVMQSLCLCGHVRNYMDSSCNAHGSMAKLPNSSRGKGVCRLQPTMTRV